MKRLVLVAAAGLVFGACSTNDGRYRDPNRPEPRTSMKRVENNAGEMVEEANKGIKRGVDSVDRVWETPRERQTELDRQRDLNRDRDMDR